MDRPIRVAQVVGHMAGGGVESTVMNHYRYIDRERVQFDFLVQSDSTLVPYDEIRSLGGRIFVIPPYAHPTAYMKRCEQTFRSIQPSIVHSHMNALSVFPLRAAKKADVPIRIAHSHSTGNPREHVKNGIKSVLRPFSKVYPTNYAACSNYTARWLFGDRIVDAGKVFIVRNAIDPELFRFNSEIRRAKRMELGVCDDEFLIGQVGRICFQKNQSFTVDVFREVLKHRPRSLLMFVGDGEGKDEMKDKVGRLGLQRSVRFLGTRGDVSGLCQAFDAMALPSMYEGLSVVAVEAQAAGLPVLASTDVSDETSIVDGLVKFVSLRDVDTWISQFVHLPISNIRDDEGDVIRSRGYDIHESASRLCDFYERLLMSALR